MMQATDDLPLNFGFSGKGSCSAMEPLREQVEAGCMALKIHEDYGANSKAIDTCLSISDELDIQVKKKNACGKIKLKINCLY